MSEKSADEVIFEKGSVNLAESNSMSLRNTPGASRAAYVPKGLSKNEERRVPSTGFRLLLLVGIFLSWIGSISLYVFMTIGPLKESSMFIISAIWIFVFVLINEATRRRRSNRL
ncbi:MAG: hypothetical protein GY847_39925 [Proteobacteria bacterium]|nr:hypothetical protein [Pseudomonadota bacterium]